MEILLYNFFKFILLFAAIMVVNTPNPVHSVLFLVLVFCTSAALLLILQVEFLALIFIVVYVGAIAVLFLFVVMMLNIRMIDLKGSVLAYFPFSILIILILSLQIGWVLSFSPSLSWDFFYIDWLNNFNHLFNIENLGLMLYTHLFLPFIVASLVLLVAMIGSIILTLLRRFQAKRQDIYYQLLRADKSIRLSNYKAL